MSQKDKKQYAAYARSKTKKGNFLGGTTMFRKRRLGSNGSTLMRKSQKKTVKNPQILDQIIALLEK